jgi:hypothetical protein
LGLHGTAFARYRKQRLDRLRNILIALAVVAVLVLAWCGRSVSARWTSIPESALVGGVVAGVAVYVLARILTPIRIKRSPGYGATVTVILDDDGFHAEAPNEQARLAWAAFTRVARFPDGILLLRGRVIRWLPDSALQNATPGEALALVRSKTTGCD